MPTESPSRRKVLAATVTPLASILGSGLLIIVPVLESVLGSLAVLGAVAVCALAYAVGTAIRHNVRVVEPLTDDGSVDTWTRRLEEGADAVIVVAYVISVALYLRILAQYVIRYATGGEQGLAERAIAVGAVALIVAIGIARGFAGLDKLDRVSLVAVLVLTTILGVTLLAHDAGSVLDGTLDLPPVAATGLGRVLLVLGGIVITVQGFETVRYLAEEFDAPTRIWASRVSQAVAASIYIGFVLVATPVMGLGTADGADSTLLDITGRVAPFLALPLVLSAVLSQFAAATADTAAADGNLRRLSDRMRGRRPFLVTGGFAIALAATVPTFTIVAVASRAFAVYYALQCVVALRTSPQTGRKLAYGALAGVMVAIAVLAQPAG